jgi:hypothetical protein
MLTTIFNNLFNFFFIQMIYWKIYVYIEIIFIGNLLLCAIFLNCLLVCYKIKFFNFFF